LTDITWYLDQKDEASFKFRRVNHSFWQPKPNGLKRGKGKNRPDGILYLTDQRLVFEQKETTGKTLACSAEKVSRTKWEIPLNLIAEVKPNIKVSSAARICCTSRSNQAPQFSQITVEVKGGVACKFWAAQIQRMISGNTKDETRYSPDADELEAIKKAPTACPSCGGTLR